MPNKLFRKGLVVGIIILMMLIPSVNAINIVKLDGNKKIRNIINVELPDLIIEGLTKEQYLPGYWYDCCRVKNIGDGIAFGSIKIEVVVIEKWLLFGIIPKTETRTYKASMGSSDGLGPDMWFDIPFAEFSIKLNHNLSIFAVVNPEQEIEESDYENNYYECFLSHFIKATCGYFSRGFYTEIFLRRLHI